MPSCPAGAGALRPLSPLQLLPRPKPIRVPGKPDISNAHKAPGQYSSPKPAQPPAKENKPSPRGSSLLPQTSSVPPGTSSIPPAGAAKGRAHRRTASEVPSSGVPAGQQVGRPCRLHSFGTRVCVIWTGLLRGVCVQSSHPVLLDRGQPWPCQMSVMDVWGKEA